ncbi:MAG: TolC family protein [Endomicrobium sp.]|jgi:outer membrane protein TolC|nr:TolC family protein [Endomicrobium sp.]
MKKFKLLLLLGFVMAAVPGYAQMLTMQQYLDLVAENNSELKSVQANIDAIKGKLAEIERTYSFFLNAGVNYGDDQSGRPFPTMERLTNFTTDVSVNKQFESGTQVSLGFQGAYTDNSPVSPSSNYEVTDLAPFVRLEQSLLKDWNGGATKASIAQARANANSALYLLEYKKQGILLNAKLAYWNLSYSRTVVDFRRSSLDRTRKILDWNNKRYNLDLAEKSDLLQSQAAFKTRELNLKLAYESEVKSSRDFNRLINVSDPRVNYHVETFISSGNNFEKDKKLEKSRLRADVLSSMEDVKSAVQAQIVSQKGMGADLVFTGQFAMNGVNKDFPKASSDLGEMNKPSYSLGLRYTLPLDFSLRKTIDQGYKSAQIAAERVVENAQLQESNDWLQLVDNWNNAKSRFALTVEIRGIQQQRNSEEQELLKKGRSTTYLVLQSEQDLDDSYLDMLKTILELISIYEQAEAFYGVNAQ